ncbi:MAG: response regulator [Armatimonadetes bacterium]|nr:response regulator [Armatimonadota bacterium]
MLSKGSVLVVDDEINLCRVLGAKLAKSGFSVIAVHDGQQAIDKIRETAFDVVLLDLMLPKVDGLSALEEIRSLDNDLPIIVMTACESADAVEKASNHGVSAYVNKPFDLESLVQLVQATSSGSSKRSNKDAAESSILFTKDQPVTLEILNGRTSGLYLSRIESKDDRTLCVLAPCHDDEVLSVVPRTPVRVGIAARDAYYSFNSYVLDLKLSETPILVLDKPGVIYRSQRRRQPRSDFEVDVHYAKIANESDRPDALLIGRSCDLSAGGIRMLARDQLRPGDLVYLETDSTGEIGPVTGVGEVLRSAVSESEPEHVVAMQFRRIRGNLGPVGGSETR